MSGRGSRLCPRSRPRTTGVTTQRCPRRWSRAPGRGRAPPRLGPRASRRACAPRDRRGRRPSRGPRRQATSGNAGSGRPAARRGAAPPDRFPRRRTRSAAPSGRSCTRRTSGLPRPGARDALGDRCAHRDDVVAVDDRRRHPEATGAVGDVGRRLALRGRDGDGDAVVLADEHERDLPEHRHVHGLEELALARGAVAEEAEHDLAGPRNWQDSAAPPAIGMWPATIALVETSPPEGSERCIEPPFPLHTPVARPISSAIIETGSTPLISASPCPR